MSVVVVATIVRGPSTATRSSRPSPRPSPGGRRGRLRALRPAPGGRPAGDGGKWASADALRAHSRGAALAAQAPIWPASSPGGRGHRAAGGAGRDPARASCAGRVALVTGAARASGGHGCGAGSGRWRVVAVDLCADDPALPYALDRARAGPGGRGGAGSGRGRGRRGRRAGPGRAGRGGAAGRGAVGRTRRGGRGRGLIAAGFRPGRSRPVRNGRCSTWTWAACEPGPGGGAGPACAARSRAAAALSPSPRPPPLAACRCSPPTARPRPGWPGSSARWPPNSAAPASPPTRSARARRRPDPGRERPALRAARGRAFAAQQPLGRLVSPAEVAAVIAFLAGDGASAMTGAVAPVDGGLAL